MKYVYSFKEGNKDMRELLGGKGANLAEMTGIGLPVPRGFTVTTEACTKYYDDGKMINEEIVNQIYEKLEEKTETSALKASLMSRAICEQSASFSSFAKSSVRPP